MTEQPITITLGGQKFINDSTIKVINLNWQLNQYAKSNNSYKAYSAIVAGTQTKYQVPTGKKLIILEYLSGEIYWHFTTSQDYPTYASNGAEWVSPKGSTNSQVQTTPCHVEVSAGNYINYYTSSGAIAGMINLLCLEVDV